MNIFVNVLVQCHPSLLSLPSVCLSVCLLVSQSVCLSVCLSLCLSVLCLSVSLFVADDTLLASTSPSHVCCTLVFFDYVQQFFICCKLVIVLCSFYHTRWSEALHGVAGSPGVHFGGNVRIHDMILQIVQLL